MSYQIPDKVKAIIIKESQKLSLYTIKPNDYVRLKNAILTLYIHNLPTNDFSLKMNLYSDAKGNKFLMSSNQILGSQIQRSANYYYCELRFDFPQNFNLLGIRNGHLLELEIGGSSFDANNFLGLILDYDNTLGNISNNYVSYDVQNVGVRTSLFFDKA